MYRTPAAAASFAPFVIAQNTEHAPHWQACLDTTGTITILVEGVDLARTDLTAILIDATPEQVRAHVITGLDDALHDAAEIWESTHEGEGSFTIANNRVFLPAGHLALI